MNESNEESNLTFILSFFKHERKENLLIIVLREVKTKANRSLREVKAKHAYLNNKQRTTDALRVGQRNIILASKF